VARGTASRAKAAAGAGTFAGLRTPRGVHPETWRLYAACVTARDRVPYSSAEARLLDGLVWYVKHAGRTAPRLTPAGPAWADALALVAAVCRVCSVDTQALLAPWARQAPSAPGVAPPVTAGVDFRPFGG
jgi:hypothetical protein